jgi:hypothetical protein
MHAQSLRANTPTSTTILCLLPPLQVLCRAVQKATGSLGVRVRQNSGPAAGQVREQRATHGVRVAVLSQWDKVKLWCLCPLLGPHYHCLKGSGGCTRRYPLWRALDRGCLRHTHQRHLSRWGAVCAPGP